MAREESIQTKIAVMANDIATIKASVENINETLKSDFVKKEEFIPVRILVYGFAALIFIAVVGAILTLVVVRPGQNTLSSTTAIPAK